MTPALALRATTLRDYLDMLLDNTPDVDAVASPLADLLNAWDAWDWRGGRDMRDRGAVVESSGTFWAVAVTSGHATASRHGRHADAEEAIAGGVDRG